MTPSLLYSGLALDRAHRLRLDADLTAMLNAGDARFVPFWRGRQLVDGTPPAACRLPRDRLPAGFDVAAAPGLLLGVAADAAPVLALDISAVDAGDDGPEMGGGRWVSLRSVGGTLAGDDAALLAYARGMLVWRGRTRHCATCGDGLAVADAGHSLRCLRPSCGALHFPRTDPAIIMLVTDGDGRALLGRQPAWPPGMYSCLAGFVEPGESLEEAVAREVWEEAGIRVLSASYAASQPWPFPSSLMIGFTALAEGGEPNPDRHEIEDVRWFTRAEAAGFGEAATPGPAGLFLPSRDSIARHLIERWLGR
ncbi:NAD(+) diphosphatase [Magnetospirillum sp. SS-4]|uniref:NAD(+) diphosphatase n=1 Tax=Magnetospirillum sp. SS-4 TaxID=2681465 RepID=UPI0015744AF1|nr:NAD(+) diphosphatase [Magnetospirillum sp. SS-4]